MDFLRWSFTVTYVTVVDMKRGEEKLLTFKVNHEHPVQSMSLSLILKHEKHYFFTDTIFVLQTRMDGLQQLRFYIAAQVEFCLDRNKAKLCFDIQFTDELFETSFTRIKEICHVKKYKILYLL